MSSLFILLSTLTHLFFLLPSTLSQTAGPINIANILVGGHHFSYFLRLLNQTHVFDQLSDQLSNSNQGMTLFAPMDNAFMNLPSGTINGLSEAKKLNLVLYHLLPKYYTMDDLVDVSNPVPTQAGGEYGSLGLNFSGKAKQVKVSTGVVETHISNALRKDFPFAVYVVDKVLFLLELASSPLEGKPAKAPSSLEGAPAKAPSSQEESPAKAPSSSNGAPAKAPSSPNGAPAKAPSSAAKNGGRRMDIGLGVAGGLVLFSIAFL
ncbi:hypothetical protein QVD17_13069 [Tagetes erecta]|uniref:FAS1 domain-containing protein n=1 Tax=Tagetes erecta TaxID=13708 RepID=A0AAD8NVX8_TARER|nr:hypothetical protein QVD17_13069 [Tagetes erecta]